MEHGWINQLGYSMWYITVQHYYSHYTKCWHRIDNTTFIRDYLLNSFTVDTTFSYRTDYSSGRHKDIFRSEDNTAYFRQKHILLVSMRHKRRWRRLWISNWTVLRHFRFTKTPENNERLHFLLLEKSHLSTWFSSSLEYRMSKESALFVRARKTNTWTDWPTLFDNERSLGARLVSCPIDIDTIKPGARRYRACAHRMKQRA